jgi:hypothetical protein
LLKKRYRPEPFVRDSQGTAFAAQIPQALHGLLKLAFAAAQVAFFVRYHPGCTDIGVCIVDGDVITGIEASLIKNAAADIPARPPPTINAFLFSIPSGFGAWYKSL